MYKALLIDDEPWALEGIELMIDWQGLGFEICGTCGNGADGLAMIEQRRPDLVIADIRMPVMDGLEMIETWRSRGGWSPVFIILSGYSDFDYARKALKAGVCSYLLKPLDEEEAEAAIRSAAAELDSERKRSRIDGVARYEETAALLKDAMLRLPLPSGGREKLEALSASQPRWNACLVRPGESKPGDLTPITADCIAGDYPLYVIPMPSGRYALVAGYGSGAAAAGDFRTVTGPLLERYPSFFAFTAAGAEETSLLQLDACLRTAYIAMQHQFYAPADARSVDYAEVKGMPFAYDYDQLAVIGEVVKAMELLDANHFEAVIRQAEVSFRAQRLYPHLARNILIHVMHEIKHLMSGSLAAKGHEEEEADLFDIPEIEDVWMPLDRLTGLVLEYGGICIERLRMEKAGEAQGIVQDINQYIRAHYREDLTIKTLAERFYLHPAYLGQLLIKKNGVGFKEFVHNLRIEEAAALLKENRHKNSEIAEMVGYSSYNPFLKQFERRMGMSPNEYKKT